MQLRKAGFGSNGHGDLRGTLIAYSDNGEPLGVEHTGNYSREGGKALLRKLAAVGIDDEVARVAIQRKLIEIRSGVDEALSAGAPRRERELPSVMVSNRPMREIADESWELLYDSEGATRFFRFGDTLSLVDTGVKPLKPRSVNVPALRHYLDRLADYQAIGKEEQMYAARPPKDILESMLAVVPPRLPPLMGVVHAPFVSPQGEVVTQEGYHNETGLYLSLGGLTLPPVPLRPTGGDVEAARDLLLDELLGDFPFQSDADKAHALAAILTPLARPLIEGPTPLFCIEAPLAGTGKSLLADVVAHIATGSPAHPMVEGGDDAEWRKRITSVLMDTPTVVLIDNLRRRLDSSALSAVVTARYWQDRPMGVSRNVTLPVRCTWLLTGNNPIFSIEIARRILRVRINANVERPSERRDFRHHPLVPWVLRERPRLLWAALTLVRAWHTAGRPQAEEAMGSYEDWVRVIGGILRVAGVEGLLQNREEVYREAETEGEPWRALLQQWWLVYGGARISAEQVLAMATEHKLLTDLRSGRTEFGARTALGMALSGMRDRVVGDVCVRAAGTQGGVGSLMWRLEKVGEAKAQEAAPTQGSLAPGEGEAPWEEPEGDKTA